MESKKVTLGSFLRSQGVSDSLIAGIKDFRAEAGGVSEEFVSRIVRPSAFFLGNAWSLAIAGILNNHNILLEGGKATGKNTLANNLSFVFGRPLWDISFNVNVDETKLIGTETYRDGNVCFNKAGLTLGAENGGFVVLDEINMAKAEAISVLHSIMDDRKVIDIPGYERIKLHPATRIIGTMNYGYTGTRELNSALVSRFKVISIPRVDNTNMKILFQQKFHNSLDDGTLSLIVSLFCDIDNRAKNAEISTACVDFRGFVSALEDINLGINPNLAFTANVVNKAFDPEERKIVKDMVGVRIASSFNKNTFFKKEAF